MKKIFSFQKVDFSKRALNLLEVGGEIIVPLCPDYIPGTVGDGISSLMYTALDVAAEILTLYPKNKFTFLIADTEGDITDLNQENILSSKNLLAQEVIARNLPATVDLFMNQFPDWHQRQYETEAKIQQALTVDADLRYYFDLHVVKRKSRYAEMFAKPFSIEETQRMQIRHYAQYLLLRSIMEERKLPLLMNYITENLRAVSKYHAFCPHKIRTELIVY